MNDPVQSHFASALANAIRAACAHPDEAAREASIRSIADHASATIDAVRHALHAGATRAEPSDVVPAEPPLLNDHDAILTEMLSAWAEHTIEEHRDEPCGSTLEAVLTARCRVAFAMRERLAQARRDALRVAQAQNLLREVLIAAHHIADYARYNAERQGASDAGACDHRQDAIDLLAAVRLALGEEAPHGG